MNRIKCILVFFISFYFSIASIGQSLQTDFAVLTNKDTIIGEVKMMLTKKKIKVTTTDKAWKLRTSDVLLCRNKGKIYYPITFDDYNSNDLYKTEFMILEVDGFIKSFVAYRLSSSGQAYSIRFIKKDEDKIAKPFSEENLLQLTNNNPEVKKKLEIKKNHKLSELEAILNDYNKSLIQK